MLIKSFHLGRYISFKWQFLKISASQGLEMKHSFQLNFFFFVSRTQRNNDVLNVLLFFLLNFALIIRTVIHPLWSLPLLKLTHG